MAGVQYGPVNYRQITWLLGIVCLVLLIGVGRLSYQLTQFEQQLTKERQATAETKTNLTERLKLANQTIAKQTQMLSQQTEELSDTRADLRETKQEVEDFEDEYRDTIKTVKDLAKLTQIDEELLQQYSRVSFLNENYVPRRLVKIDDRYVAPGRGDEHFHAYAWRFLEKLLEDAARDDVTILVLSAYRSFNEQGVLKGRYLRTYGEGANAFSAEQGFSEHQLGTAVDFTAPELGGQLDGFADTKAYQWLLKNAHKHGFILSYPEGNEFYIFEPWHWRFVGEDLARDLKRDGRRFYEVPQRELDKYRLSLFD